MQHTEKRSLERNLLKDVVFGYRLASQQRLEDWLAAVGDGDDPGNGSVDCGRVITGVFAERALPNQFCQIDLELDHHFRRGRHFDVHRLASH